MTVDFLSKDWFAEVERAFQATDVANVVGPARLQYLTHCESGQQIRWAQLISERRVRWRLGAIANPDVEIECTRENAFRILARQIDGTHAADVTTISAQRPSGLYRGPPPPMDLAHQSELEEMPHVAGANLRYACEHAGGPFGTVHCTITFEDGRFTDMSLGVLEDADVAVSLPFHPFVLHRQGRISALEALEHGRIGGSQGALALMAGILECEPYRRAMAAAAAGPASLALAALGVVAEQDPYRRAFDSLLPMTTVAGLGSMTEPVVP